MSLWGVCKRNRRLRCSTRLLKPGITLCCAAALGAGAPGAGGNALASWESAGLRVCGRLSFSCAYRRPLQAQPSVGSAGYITLPELELGYCGWCVCAFLLLCIPNLFTFCCFSPGFVTAGVLCRPCTVTVMSCVRVRQGRTALVSCQRVPGLGNSRMSVTQKP